MWFIVKITKNSDEVNIEKAFDSFETCWDVYNEYLKSPYKVENAFLRICSANSESEVIDDIRAKRREDKEIAIKEKGTPERIIKEWAKVYGVDLNKAAEFTTEKFREGKPKDVWASETSQKLKDIDFKAIDGKVVKHTFKEPEFARVDFRRIISTNKGTFHKIESYKLKSVNGRWFIDEVEVREAGADLGGGEE
ncbi:MAG: hypothetical protein L0Y68_09390 [Candidatus Dadabacteria bacterium]|nr:hypothetical protein [Candidatus Dadabacteria bacterium]